MASYTLDTIREMISKDLTISEELLNLLEQETPSLRERNFDAVKDILFNKAPLLDQLKKHADLRKEWLLSLYKIADESHWKTFISSFNDPDILQQWEAVNDNIKRCKDINDSNGVMVTRGKKTYSRLLKILKGDTEQDGLYTAKGNRQASAQSCTYTRA